MNTATVEAIKIALKQEAEGILVTFRIQPDDMPTQLLTAGIMARFALAMVEIDDNELPKPADPERKTKAVQNRNVMRAAILCGEESFQTFLKKKHRKVWDASIGEGAAQAGECMRQILNIESRKEIGTDPDALHAFDALDAEYQLWRRG
jgi:hypothetical protein